LSKTPDKETVNFTVRLPQLEADALTLLSKKSHKSRNDLIVDAVRVLLDDEIERREDFESRLERLMEQDRETLDLLAK
jgi:hypothetical protein